VAPKIAVVRTVIDRPLRGADAIVESEGRRYRQSDYFHASPHAESLHPGSEVPPSLSLVREQTFTLIILAYSVFKRRGANL
jgi:hypothetical protein